MTSGMLTPFRSRELIDPGAMIRPFQFMQHEMTRLFEGFLLGGLGLPPQEISEGDSLIPRMEVKETEQELRLCIELPGVAEPDIKVQIQDDDTLIIRAEKKSMQDANDETVRFNERSFGVFQRTLQLPFQISAQQVNARFENGVLSITLPRPGGQPRPTTHDVPIKTGAQREGNGRVRAEEKRSAAE